MSIKGNYEIYLARFDCTDGENGTRIETPEECKQASKEYGYSYLREVEYTDRPAGCYLYEEGEFKNTFFNKIDNASLTDLTSIHYEYGVMEHVKSICNSRRFDVNLGTWIDTGTFFDT